MSDEVDKLYHEEIRLVPERAKFAAALLALAFKWDQSKEGKEYWRDAYLKLYELAEKGGADMTDMKKPSQNVSAQTQTMVDALLGMITPGEEKKE